MLALLNLAIFQVDPKRVPETTDPEITNPTSSSTFPKRPDIVGQPARQITQPEEVARLEGFLVELSKTIQTNPQFVMLKATVREISQSAIKTRDEILLLIKEPWSV